MIATNTATNVANTTQTNKWGLNNFPFLPIGNYTLTVEGSGFQKSVIGPFQLEVNQIGIDPKVEVGVAQAKHAVLKPGGRPEGLAPLSVSLRRC